MRIDKLHLKNFRCFEDIEFEFHPQFNLIVGENGAGKTALLEALTLALNDVVCTARGEFHPQDPETFRRVVASSLKSSRFVANPQHPQMNVTLDFEGSHKCQWSSPWGFQSPPIGGLQNLHAREKQSAEGARPLLAAIPIERTWPSESAKSKNLKELERTLERLGLPFLESGPLTLVNVADWILSQRWKTVAEEQESAIYTLARKKLVESCPWIEGIGYDIQTGVLWVDFQESRSRLPWKMLSSGQKGYLGVLLHLIIRAALLNPDLESEVLNLTPGIVLIDELDLHLHPRWQRSIVSNLMKVFPKVQFFATTHSPVIIGEVKPEMLTLLSRAGERIVASRGSESYGFDASWILEYIMGASRLPPEVQSKVEDIEAMLDDFKFDKAEEVLGELRRMVGGLNPDVIRLGSVIKTLQAAARAKNSKAT